MCVMVLTVLYPFFLPYAMTVHSRFACHRQCAIVLYEFAFFFLPRHFVFDRQCVVHTYSPLLAYLPLRNEKSAQNVLFYVFISSPMCDGMHIQLCLLSPKYIRLYGDYDTFVFHHQCVIVPILTCIYLSPNMYTVTRILLYFITSV